MATKKAPKKSPKKSPKKKGRKAPARKAPAPRPVKKKATRRQPPMHANLSHAELSEPQTEHDEAFEIFKSFDRDRSGSIDRLELSRLLEALGQELGEDELAVALEVVDANHSGRISWDEFKAWWSAR